MPHPFIILENHFSTGSRQFIANNASTLKEMGYTKFLLEMNSEVSPEMMKQQLRMILSNPAAIAYHVSSKALLEMLLALEKNGIFCEFIDPETQEEANKQNMKLQDAVRRGNVSETISDRQRLTDLRDETMASKIMQESVRHDGGVLFLGGFQHKHLVKLLESSQYDYYRYAIFVDTSKDQMSPASSVGNPSWHQIPNEPFRNQFYQANVRFINLATKPSFEMIEIECKLTNYKRCDKPAVGAYLSKATMQEYSFMVDEHSVVTASAALEGKELQETIGRIKKDFPRLRFFTEQRDAQTFLNIPGINLPENSDCLKNGFIKLGIMKP